MEAVAYHSFETLPGQMEDLYLGFHFVYTTPVKST